MQGNICRLKPHPLECACITKRGGAFSTCYPYPALRIRNVPMTDGSTVSNEPANKKVIQSNSKRYLCNLTSLLAAGHALTLHFSFHCHGFNVWQKNSEAHLENDTQRVNVIAMASKSVQNSWCGPSWALLYSSLHRPF